MGDPQIDLKALLIEHEDCDAGTVQKLRNGLVQGGAQFRTLREVTDTLKKRLEANAGNPAAFEICGQSRAVDPWRTDEFERDRGAPAHAHVGSFDEGHAGIDDGGFHRAEIG